MLDVWRNREAHSARLGADGSTKARLRSSRPRPFFTAALVAAMMSAQTVSAQDVLGSLPRAATAVAERVDALFILILWITSGILIVVFSLLAFALYRFRAGSNAKASYSHGNTTIEVIWTAIPMAILIGLAFISRELWNDMQIPSVGAPILVVEVRPRQYQWEFLYAGEDGRIGTSDDVTTINQLRVPAGGRIDLVLRSQDVIHSFFVPQFRLKQDAVPGLTTRYSFQVDQPGTFDIACAELCGLGHYRMKGYLTVLDADAYRKWYTGRVARQMLAKGSRQSGRRR